MSNCPRALSLLALLLTACPPAAADKADDEDTGTEADPCPVAVVDPDALAWTDLVAGEPATLELSVLNNCAGDAPLTLELSATDPAFDVSPGVGSVAPGEVATFTVTATVTTQPGASGTLQIVTNDPTSPLVSVALSAGLAADQDGDGVAYADDCDDADASAWPGAPDDWYDGTDSDCAGNSDYDADADGFDSDGYGGIDCDDGDAAVNPGAEEAWYDGVDANCDGLSDDDADADGFDVGADCDDDEPTAYPGGPEAWYDGIDGDCAGGDDYDQDGDGGQADAYGGTDCDDTDAAVYYGAPDAWYDGVDSDCAGNDDDDADTDGHAATTRGGDDCDDTDAAVSPDAPETWYDGVDSDCDGASDYDQDADGVAAYAHGGADCDDTDASTLDGPVEAQNGLDDDCDGYVDEGFAAAGDVVLTEIMTNPAAVSDTVGEWFELYNDSAYAIDLYGWTIYSDDGGSLTISTSLPVAAGGYVVLGAEDDATLNGGVAVDYQYARASFALSDTEGIYVLSGATTVTGFEFDSSWPIDEGYALSLDPSAYADPTDSANWCVATSALSGGDYGTPGAANDGCPQIDNDGDGYSDDDGDCDDLDAAISPDAVEVDDGVDQDCSDVVDDVEVDLSAAPYTEGVSSLSYNYPATAADLDGDGTPELVYSGGSYRYGYGTIYVLDGGDYASWSGLVTAYDDAAIATSSTGYENTLATELADNTGDGVADLVMTTASGGSELPGWYLFEAPSGSMTAADATVTSARTSAATALGAVDSSADFNGDGVAEVVYADGYSSSYGATSGGMVGIYDVSGVSGSITEASADVILRGTTYGEVVGYGAVFTGDMNGDGYMDLGVPTAATVTYGWLGDGLATTGTLDLTSVATFSVTDASSASYLRDVDGDGADDFMTWRGQIWTDLASAAGTLTSADATTDFTASSGYSCQTAAARTDLDGDGAEDIVMGCGHYEGSTYEYSTMFLGSDILSASTADETQSFLSYVWTGVSYAYIIGAWDLDADGDDELVTYGSGSSGAAYAYIGEP